MENLANMNGLMVMRKPSQGKQKGRRENNARLIKNVFFHLIIKSNIIAG